MATHSDMERGNGDGRDNRTSRHWNERTHSTQDFQNENAFRFNRGKEGDQEWRQGDYTDDDYRFDNTQRVNYGERYGFGAYGKAHYDPRANGGDRRGTDFGRGIPSGMEQFGGNTNMRESRDSRGDHRGRGPKNYSRTDERIREEVCERLTMDHDVDPSDVDVVVSNGEVTLKGTIADRPMKRRAEDLADRVMGVRDVHNELRLTQGRASSDDIPASSKNSGKRSNTPS